MSKIPLHSLSMLFPFLSLLIQSLSSLVISQSLSSEQEILLGIKRQWGTQSPMQSWNATTSHCQWPGIKCASNRTVTGVSLGNQNITGEFPPSICDLNNLTTLDLGYNFLGGQFPTVLYKCTNLQNLNLTQNLFVGQLPKDISNLSSSLQHLDLSYNNFTGDIPSSIGQLKWLITLHLEWNLFNGTFPSELGDLENLEELVLAYNSFSPMELPTEFGELKSINFIWMTFCNLIGKIPESFGNLYSLEHLDLAHNKLEGGIPSRLFLLKSLKFLYLYDNALWGEFPTLIKAPNLMAIDLSMNNLTGIIPSGIGSLPKLEVLNLFSNQFHGILPPGIGFIPTLKTLKLWSNRFSGPLPPELGFHSRLEHLVVSDNDFTGPLPKNLCAGGALVGMVAFNNRLNGSIPESLGHCSSLLIVKLSDNYFSGEIPEGLWALQNILILELSNNQLFGQLPKKLTQNKNLISGSIPLESFRLSNLSSLYLGGNRLSGEIPDWLWTLDNLQVLVLRNNQFSGQLPDTFASKMSSIDISNNKISGRIPPSLATSQQLLVFEASNNLLSGTVHVEFTSLSRLSWLTLDGNHLSGELPSEINSWTSLYALILSRNDFTGSIPSALGSLPFLMRLDLSNNQLSGQIPPELGHLSPDFLNLSSNKLTGGIPYGYDNAAYANSFLNTSLCSVTGVLDLPKCKTHRRNVRDFLSKYLTVIIALVLGLVAFLVLIYFVWSKIFRLQKRKQIQDLPSWEMSSFHRLEFAAELILGNLTETNLIGTGGSGKVYRIPVNGSGSAVAAKRIWNGRMTNEKEFLTEVQLLGTIRHLNILKLLCCILSKDSKILVYEYMENQSLDKWIHKGKQRPVSVMGGFVQPMILDWPVRLRVAIGAAKGLSYMHHDCSPPIIHRDVKSSNILLDSEFNAKIADFGFAKILPKPGGEPSTVSSVAGTFGYMAPEYCYSTKVNEKIDIYSFGVVLLELVTGKEAHTGDEYLNLAQWAWKHYSQGHPVSDAFDNEVKEDCYLEVMTNVFMLGLICTSTLASSRPLMKEVLEVLRR